MEQTKRFQWIRNKKGADMSTTRMILLYPLLACFLFGETQDAEWNNRLAIVEAEMTTNLATAVADADRTLLSAMFKKVVDVTTSVSRRVDTKSVERIQKLQMRLLDAICTVREWPAPLKNYAPNHKEMPTLSREGVNALGDFRGRYEEIPDPAVRSEVLSFWRVYSPTHEKYLTKSKMEDLRVTLESLILFDLSEEGRSGNQYSISFSHTVSNTVTNPKLIKHLMELSESHKIEKRKK